MTSRTIVETELQSDIENEDPESGVISLSEYLNRDDEPSEEGPKFVDWRTQDVTLPLYDTVRFHYDDDNPSETDFVQTGVVFNTRLEDGRIAGELFTLTVSDGLLCPCLEQGRAYLTETLYNNPEFQASQAENKNKISFMFVQLCKLYQDTQQALHSALTTPLVTETLSSNG